MARIDIVNQNVYGLVYNKLDKVNTIERTSHLRTFLAMEKEIPWLITLRFKPPVHAVKS